MAADTALDGWGYSLLNQIDRDNVGRLRMVWSRALTEGSQEVIPLLTAACSTWRIPGRSSRLSTP